MIVIGCQHVALSASLLALPVARGIPRLLHGVSFIGGSLEVTSTFLHKPQGILGLPLLRLNNGKLNKQKKLKCLSE